MHLVYLRLVTNSEVNTLDSLLPKGTSAVVPSKNGKQVSSVPAPSAEETSSRRQQLLLDQYKLSLNNLEFLRAPSIIDLVAILGAQNGRLSARLIKNLYEMKVSFSKEVVDSLKESVKVNNLCLTEDTASIIAISTFKLSTRPFISIILVNRHSIVCTNQSSS